MEFLASPLGVFLILIAVTIAAVSFEPSDFVGAWRELAQRYETDTAPPSATFLEEDVELGRGNFASIDAALDDSAFWITYNGPNPKKPPHVLKVPWDCIRYRQSKPQKQNFQLRGKKPIEFWVSTQLGDALQRRSDRFEVEDQL